MRSPSSIHQTTTPAVAPFSTGQVDLFLSVASSAEVFELILQEEHPTSVGFFWLAKEPTILVPTERPKYFSGDLILLKRFDLRFNVHPRFRYSFATPLSVLQLKAGRIPSMHCVSHCEVN